jgi:hypothetical protein
VFWLVNLYFLFVKAWNISRIMQSGKDSKTTALYNTRICCDKRKHPLNSPSVQHTEQKYNPRQWGKHTPGLTVSLYAETTPPDDHCCVVSLQPSHIIRYIDTIVSGQCYYADWRECNAFRETVPPYISFFALYPDKAAGEQDDVWNTWNVCPLNPVC